jgi:hypothetical protein
MVLDCIAALKDGFTDIKILSDSQTAVGILTLNWKSSNYIDTSSLLQGKHLPFSPSPLRLNIFRLFVILSLTQLYHYTPEIFLFSTATFKYTYRPFVDPIISLHSRDISLYDCHILIYLPGPPQTNWTRISANAACFILKSLKRIQPLKKVL